MVLNDLSQVNVFVYLRKKPTGKLKRLYFWIILLEEITLKPLDL